MIEQPSNNPAEQENKVKAFNDLFEQIPQGKSEQIPTIEYNLPYPKEDFLRFIVAEKNILLHGSSTKDMETIEPRQANDKAKASGNKKAVYGVTDPVLPIFYAIQDREKIRQLIRDGVIEGGTVDSGTEIDPETGELEYKFSIPKKWVDVEPWTHGIIYIFDKNEFNPEQDNDGKPSGEWTSEVPVKPLAKLEVKPEDFRYMDKVQYK